MKDNKTKILAIFLAIAAIAVVIIPMFFKKTTEEENDILIVKNPSEFFTVNSCLYRTITYVYKNDIDSLLKVIDEKYKKNNNINKENVLELFPNIDNEVTFVSKEMYYEELNKDIKKYYVRGCVQSNIIHDFDIVEKEEDVDLYYIVMLNSEKQIFSVEPYDGKIFMDGEKNE